MKQDTIEIEGTLEADGTLVVPEKVSLPPGRVRVTVQSLSDTTGEQPLSHAAAVEQFWAGMHAIWAAQEARGHVPREKEEIDAEIRALREETEERMQRIENLHRELEADHGGPLSENCLP
jgi:hypothetical protein